VIEVNFVEKFCAKITAKSYCSHAFQQLIKLILLFKIFSVFFFPLRKIGNYFSGNIRVFAINDLLRG